jgi:hypothetical protein
LTGALTVCARGGGCLAAERRCDVITIPAAGQIERSPFFLSRNRTPAETRELNLLHKQERFPKDWRAPTLACSARAAEEAANGGSNHSGSNQDEPDRGNID